MIFENLSSESPPLIAVTGATGNIGFAFAQAALERGFRVRSIVRTTPKRTCRQPGEVFPIGSLDFRTDWSRALADVDYVVHCVGMKNQFFSFRNKFYSQQLKVNVGVTLNLAEQATSMGVKRIVYVSSAAVDFFRQETQKSSFAHQNYARSKIIAESSLSELSRRTGLEVVIVRPAAVYGVDINSFIDLLIRLIKLRVPLPTAFLNNRRSILNIRNLTDFLILCLSHPNAAGNHFSISDCENLSLQEIANYIGKSLNYDLKMLPVPLCALDIISVMFGPLFDIRRFTECALVDMSLGQHLLGWKPVVSTQEGLSELIAK